MTVRERWCQYHQALHAFPLHCRVCGEALPEGRYYNHVECKKQKPRKPRYCAACEKRLETKSRKRFCPDCVSWKHRAETRDQKRDQEKLATWIGAQKP